MTAGLGKVSAALQAEADVDAEELVYLADRLHVGPLELDVEAVRLTARGRGTGGLDGRCQAYGGRASGAVRREP